MRKRYDVGGEDRTILLRGSHYHASKALIPGAKAPGPDWDWTILLRGVYCHPFKEYIRDAEALEGCQSAPTILLRCVDWIVQKFINQISKAPLNAVLMEDLEKASGIRRCPLTYRNRWMVIRHMEIGGQR